MRRRVMEPPEGVRTDIEILCELGRRLGHRRQFSYADTEAVFDELRRATRGGAADYSGISYARINCDRRRVLAVPVASITRARRVSSPRRFRRENGRAHFHAVSHRSIAEEPTAAYPLFLTTGRLLAQYQSGTQTRRTRSLQDLAGEPLVEIHPTTASSLGLSVGRPRDAENAARHSGVHGEDDGLDSAGHGVRAVSLGRRAVGEQPHEQRARSDEQDARVQGLRDAHLASPVFWFSQGFFPNFFGDVFCSFSFYFFCFQKGKFKGVSRWVFKNPRGGVFFLFKTARCPCLCSREPPKTASRSC